MRVFWSVLAVLFLALAVMGCGKRGADDFAGMWTGTIKFSKSQKMADVTYSLNLKADKTFEFTNSTGDKDTGTWDYKDNRITLSYPGKADGLRPAIASTQVLVVTSDGEGLNYESNDNPGQKTFVRAK